MHQLTRQNDTLYCQGVNLKTLAETYGTPCYVYDAQTIVSQFKRIDEALTMRHMICYAVKANSHIAILHRLNGLGAGFDIVSSGELARVMKAGGDPQKIMYSGVAKSTTDIKEALALNIGCLNVESIPELERIIEVATTLKQQAPIALRVNPDIDAHTHPYIATGLREHKFGIAADLVPHAIQMASNNRYIELKGLGCHIGSQLTDIDAYESALSTLLAMIKASNHPFQWINLGGGMGLEMNIHAFCKRLNERFESLPYQLILEPGRFIMAEAGILLTRVEYIKSQYDKHFAIVDAGMNDLIRPALYDAHHDIENVVTHQGKVKQVDIVGPVCESADFLGLKRDMVVEAGDILAVKEAGAYGFSMCSHYNSRPKVAEILIENGEPRLIGKRETQSALFARESL